MVANTLYFGIFPQLKNIGNGRPSKNACFLDLGAASDEGSCRAIMEGATSCQRAMNPIL